MEINNFLDRHKSLGTSIILVLCLSLYTLPGGTGCPHMRTFCYLAKYSSLCIQLVRVPIVEHRIVETRRPTLVAEKNFTSFSTINDPVRDSAGHVIRLLDIGKLKQNQMIVIDNKCIYYIYISRCAQAMGWIFIYLIRLLALWGSSLSSQGGSIIKCRDHKSRQNALSHFIQVINFFDVKLTFTFCANDPLWVCRVVLWVTCDLCLVTSCALPSLFLLLTLSISGNSQTAGCGQSLKGSFS